MSEQQKRAQNVGIIGIEIYFPKRCISQSALEEYDNVSAGKYTIGFGQKEMSCTDDREDICSFLLTVTDQLMKKYNVDPASIGRLDVGTETLIDKSKSVKSVLMQLFPGNSDIEGLDSKNACYGGTAALFNAINWMQSDSWDGRNAIVAAGDIAIYAAGGARPVGGAGAVALLIGPNAPVVFESIRATHMAHAYDFYKPDLSSEYPTVDGPLTITSYLSAIDAVYDTFRRKIDSSSSVSRSSKASLKDFDYVLFHSPYGKLVQKGHARLLYNDYLTDKENALFESVDKAIGDLARDQTYTSKEVEKAFIGIGKDSFNTTMGPGMLTSKRCGNMYTASLYAALASLFSSESSEKLQGKKIAFFSYGSGLAASFFTAKVVGDVLKFAQSLDLVKRLDERDVVPPSDYTEMMKLREANHNAKEYSPQGDIKSIWPESFYLDNIDSQFRRTYKQMSKSS